MDDRHVDTVRDEYTKIERWIVSDRYGTIRLCIRSSVGWELRLPEVKQNNLRESLRVCGGFLSGDAFEIIRRQSGDVVELIDLVCQHLKACCESDLDLGLIVIGYGPYFGQRLNNIPFEYLLEEFRANRLHDFLTWEYVNRERKRRLHG